MSENIGAVADTHNEGQASTNTATTTTSASNEKTFTQEEVNQIVTKRLAQLERKFSGIDLEEYNSLKSMKEQQDQEAAIKRQEFDRVLGQVKSASESKIQALQQELEKIKIDGALIAEASQRRAVAPDKVAALLRSQLKLTQDGAVEVVDSQGQTRFNADRAQPLGIADLVEEFLNQNPYFVAASPAGTGAKSGVGQETTLQQINVADLDMRNPKHREIYRQMQQKR